MIKRVLLLFLLISLFPIISSLCEEGQININTASPEKLDLLYGIGLVKTQAIINTRPFDSIADLIHVNGIGNVTLNKIIEQGLACLGEQAHEEDQDPTDNTSDDEEEEDNQEADNEVDSLDNIPLASNNKAVENIKLTPITLNPKVIKSENDSENLDKDTSDYAFYSFIVFCILLGFLFLIKKIKT